MLTCITGPMFAGKTTELIRRVDRAMNANLKVGVFRPMIDRRSGTFIRSHNNLEREAQSVNSLWDISNDPDIVPDYDLLVIDELQFFEFPASVLWRWSRYMDIAVAGLDTDFTNQPFRLMSDVLAYADEVLKINSICSKCKSKSGRYTQRIDSEGVEVTHGERILVGGKESYETRCDDCFVSYYYRGSKVKLPQLEL